LIFSNAASAHLRVIRRSCEARGIAVDAFGSAVGRVAETPPAACGRVASGPDFVAPDARVSSRRPRPRTILEPGAGACFACRRSSAGRSVSRNKNPANDETCWRADRTGPSRGTWGTAPGWYESFLNALVGDYRTVNRAQVGWRDQFSGIPREVVSCESLVITVRKQADHKTGLGPWLVRCARSVLPTHQRHA